MTAAAHTHAFTDAAKVETCHLIATLGTCDCGTMLLHVRERDPESDASAEQWVRPECERCSMLVAGAGPTGYQEVFS